MIKTMIINAVLKFASDALLQLLNRGVEELQKRKDNDLYEEGDTIKDVLNKVSIKKQLLRKTEELYIINF